MTLAEELRSEAENLHRRVLALQTRRPLSMEEAQAICRAATESVKLKTRLSVSFIERHRGVGLNENWNRTAARP